MEEELKENICREIANIPAEQLPPMRGMSNSITLKIYLFNEVAYQNAFSIAVSITCKISNICIPSYIPFIVLTGPGGIAQCCDSCTKVCHCTGSSKRLI
jgi:hypothetical protein